MAEDLRVLALQLAVKALDVAAGASAGDVTIADLEGHMAELDGFTAAVPVGVDAACAVFKAEAAKRFTLGVAYPALSPDVGKAVDGFRDYATPELIESAAWNYMAEHRAVGLLHFTPDEAAGHVVESYIYRGPDWACKAADGTEQLIRSGDWLLGTVWTPPAWKAIESGLVDGLSFVGRAARRRPQPENLALLRR